MESNQSNPTSTRKRTILTLKTKIQIINKFDKGEKISQISRNLNLPNSTVSSIIRDKKRIVAASKNDSILNSSTIIRKRHGIIAQTEGILKTWCEQQAEQNIKLTRNDICSQAKIIFEDLKRDYGEAAKDEKFLASKGWYFRFKNRCEGNRISDPQEEPEEQEIEKVDEVRVKKEKHKYKPATSSDIEVNISTTFTDHLKAIIDEGGYTPQTVFNVDEISLYWKKIPETCYLARQEVNFGEFDETKDRLTILLGGNASGDLKLKPLVIYRTENPSALRNKSKGGLPVIWKSNSRACMTAYLFEDWFGHYLIPEVEKYCFRNNIPCKILLIIDSAVYHPHITLVDFDHRVSIVFLSPGDASTIQPIFYGVSPIFKAIYTRHVFSHLIKVSRGNEVVTVDEMWKEFNILDSIRLIADSWADISENDWRYSWSKLCPFFYGHDDKTQDTYSATVDEIVNLALELDMKLHRKDVTDLLDSHNKEPTIEELIEMQEYSVNEEMEVQDPLLEGAMTVESLTEAFSHIKMGLQILENIDSNEQRARTTRIGVMKLMSAYEEILNDKMKLSQQDESIDATTSNN